MDLGRFDFKAGPHVSLIDDVIRLRQMVQLLTKEVDEEERAEQAAKSFNPRALADLTDAVGEV